MSPPKTPEIPENDIYQFLEETHPAWVIAHWGELAQTPRCPLDLFHANPRFFLSWVLIWEKTAKDLFLQWDVTRAWESLCRRAWPAALKAWEPETITRWCRLSNLWDHVQEKTSFQLPMNIFKMNYDLVKYTKISCNSSNSAGISRNPS